jgi:hypothetical protein
MNFPNTRMAGALAGVAAVGLALTTATAAAQTRNAGGDWTGKYVCGQGVTGARLILSDDGSRGVFHFYPLPENPRAKEGCYQVTGIFNNATGALAVVPGVWYMRPRGYMPAAFSGTVDERGQNFAGRIIELAGCASVFLSHAAPTQPLPSVCARGLP